MKKGFTLIELLAVIIVLGFLTLITVVSVGTVLNNSKKKLTSIQINNLVEATKSYHLKEGMSEADYDLENTRTCININELFSKGYIDKKEIIDVETSEKIEGSVKITYKVNNYVYEYQDKDCTNYDKGIICERVTSTDVGNKPEGKFIAGDAYNCKVDPNKEPYKFYILKAPGDDSDTVELIMDRNINSDGSPSTKLLTKANAENGIYNAVAWLSKSEGDLYPYDENACLVESGCTYNTKGPITAMDFLQAATKNWINIKKMIIDSYDSHSYTNDLYGIFQMKTYHTYARMPTYGEVSVKTESNAYLYDNLKNDNDSDSPHGYWTSSSINNDPVRSWVVYYDDCVVSGTSVNRDEYHGIRPVISVYKFQME